MQAIVLELFLKYVSDAFDLRRAELKAQLENPEEDYYLDPADYGGAESASDTKEIDTELEVRDSVRAKLRNLVRRALRRWKYPPDGADEAIELCLKQAETLSQHWSAEATSTG